MREDLDFAAREIGIDGAFGSWSNQTGNADYKLVAQDLCSGKGQSTVRVTDDLYQTFAVPQVDENDAAMIASSVNPATDADHPGQERAADATAVVGALQVALRQIALRNFFAT